MSTNSSRSHTFEGNTVPKATRLIFPWSGIFRDACYALIGTFLMQYAITAGVLSTNSSDFKAQYGVITIAMIIALVWDGINDPLMGFILEKCHFKSGKFRPWILWGSLGNALVVASMFFMPFIFSGLRGWGYVVFMIIMYILWDAFFSMNDIGYWSMLPALTSDPQQRAKLTTHTAIAASIGTFVMNIMMFVLPGAGLGSTIQVYMMAAIGVAALFFVSQLLIYIYCKEKSRDLEQEEISEHSSILDLFRVIKKNKQLLFAALGMGLYYLGSFILTGIGQNYFYMVYGYGGGKGGMVATAIAAIYVLATVLAQAFYPMLAKKFKRKQILTVSAIIIFVAYLAFFLIAFPVFGDKPIAWNTPDGSNIFWVFGGSMSLLYVMSFLFFGASGIFYLAVLVMFQDAIDYGELMTGERKESICFAWRPLDVKLASGLNRGLQYLVYALTGTALAINTISNMEGDYNAYLNSADFAALSKAEQDAYRNGFPATVDDAISVERWQLILFGVIVIGVILLVFAASYILLRFCYKLDEDKVKEVLAKLEEKHKSEEVADTDKLAFESIGGEPSAAASEGNKPKEE
ncbi:MAG: MFS transporter [Bacilli bacterium]|nr:MFS transporter [Bacilli bacterium]